MNNWTRNFIRAIAKFPRVFLVRPRLLISLVVGVGFGVMLPSSFIQFPITRAILGWILGVGIYLVLSLRMMFWSSHEEMRARAVDQDEGRELVLVLVVIAALMCIGSIVAELSIAKDFIGIEKYAHVALAGATIATSWAFTQVMFTQHYAHDYYLSKHLGRNGGLHFPGGEEPDYGDFLYFACVIGTSAQTADISFTSRAMRRIGTIHCILAFFFNTTLIALTINIASGLL
jgi:uncharacterized membrane protein